LGAAMLQLGEPQKAIPLIQQALHLSSVAPADVMPSWRMGMAHMFLRHDQDALEWFLKARTESPSHGWWLLRELTAVCAWTGDAATAKVYLENLLRAWPQVSISVLKARRESNDPEYLRLSEQTLYAGLLKAGLPEE